MWASLIAVIGTLAGAVVSGLLQHRATRADRDDARAEQVRRDRIETVTALASAVSDHRRAMWEVTDAILTGKPEERISELRDESHRTRSNVTDPAVRIKLLFQDETVRTAAKNAVQATYDMRNASTVDELQTMRRNALELHDALIETASDFLNR